MSGYKYVLLLAIVLGSQLIAIAQTRSAGSALLEMRYRLIRAQDRSLTTELTRIQTLKNASERIVGYRQLIAALPNKIVPNVGLKVPLTSFVIRDLVEVRAPEAEIAALMNDIKNDPNNTFTKAFIVLGLSSLLVDKGMALAATGDAITQALSFASEVKLRVESIAELESLLGQVFEHQGQYGLAQTWLEKSIARSSDSEAYLHLADVYWQQGKRAQAQQLLETAVVTLSDPNLHLKLATMYEQQGDSTKLGETLLTTVVLINDPGKKAQQIEKLKQHYRKEKGSDQEIPNLIAARNEQLLEKVALVDSKYEKGAAPAWQLTDLDGKKVDSAEFRGKIVVLNWWGSWCPPCRAELPHFQKFYENYRDQGVVFIAMNWEQPDDSAEEQLAKAKKIVQANKYTFPVVVDLETTIGKQYDLEGFPSVYIIDRQGALRYRNVGFSPGLPYIIETQIKALLNAPPLAK